MRLLVCNMDKSSKRMFLLNTDYHYFYRFEPFNQSLMHIQVRETLNIYILNKSVDLLSNIYVRHSSET
jgi:hypothetical protein